MKKVFRFIAAAALVCLCAACKKDPIEVQSVSLDKTTLTIAEGSSEQLTATVKPDNATNRNVNWSSSDNTVATVSAGGKVTAVKEGTATIIVTTEDGGKTATCKVTILLPEGALPGVFSVSDTKKIRFSKGNLQTAYVHRSGVGYVWGFADNQYDFVGNAAGNTTIDSPTRREVIDLFGWSTIDLFGWSTSATNFGINTSTDKADYSGDFVDWGENIGNGSIWRTLTTDEWQYLFKTRTNASGLYKTGVTVCDMANCVIIAPDDFTDTIKTSYDASTWPAAEAAGLVCLPAAGLRNGSNVFLVGEYGHYWSSSTIDSSNGYCLDFHSSEVYPGNQNYHYRGFSVRLVTECQ